MVSPSVRDATNGKISILDPTCGSAAAHTHSAPHVLTARDVRLITSLAFNNSREKRIRALVNFCESPAVLEYCV